MPASFSPDAQEIYETFRLKGWITWGGIRHGVTFGADHFRIGKAWTELERHGYAKGRICQGELGQIIG